MEVTVAWVAPGVEELVPVQVEPGATVRHVLARCGLVERYTLDLEALAVGIFGTRTTLDAPVRDGDRVELYRSLVVDPKEARRRRAAHATARRAARKGAR